MKYLIILLSTLFLCDNSLAASAEAEDGAGPGRRSSNASNLSEGSKDILDEIDDVFDERAAKIAAIRKALEEENAAKDKKSAKIKEDYIALRDHDVEKDGCISLSETFSEIIEEVNGLSDGAEAEKIQSGTVRMLNKFKSKLNEEDQEKVVTAFAKLPTA